MQYSKTDLTSQLVTFGSRGVSGHPNHIALLSGVTLAVQKHSHLKGFYLADVSIPKKFTSFYGSLLEFTPSRPGMRFYSTPSVLYGVLHAMHAHESQLVWFRYLYLTFTRYILVNDLIPIDPSATPHHWTHFEQGGPGKFGHKAQHTDMEGSDGENLHVGHALV